MNTPSCQGVENMHPNIKSASFMAIGKDLIKHVSHITELKVQFSVQFHIDFCVHYKVNHLEGMRGASPPPSSFRPVSPRQWRGGKLSLEMPIRNSNREGSSNMREMSMMVLNLRALRCISLYYSFPSRLLNACSQWKQAGRDRASMTDT